MKTLNEIYTEVMENDELKTKFATVKNADEAVTLVKELGGDASAEEIAAFLKENSAKSGELSDAELEQVAGGKSANKKEALMSVLTAGIGCAFRAITSATVGNVGTAIDGDKMLCDEGNYF